MRDSSSPAARRNDIRVLQHPASLVLDFGLVIAGGDRKSVSSDLDKGIEKNLDAALIENRLHKVVKYDVKNGVVILTGEVNSQSRRAQAEQAASSVPNVQQVVNELQIKNQEVNPPSINAELRRFE